jgi:hypothetical protein
VTTRQAARASAAPSARLEAVEQGIDIALAVFATLQPAMQAFYGALDDEQKARLQRDMTMSAAPAPLAERSRERADQRSDAFGNAAENIS